VLRSGLVTSGMDPDVRPQDDLFGHVNGSWFEQADIPADRAAYGALHVLREEAENQVRAILEEAAAGDAPAGSNERKLGDLYSCFVDEAGVESLGGDPIRDQLRAVAEVRDSAELVRLLGRLEREGVEGFASGHVTTDRRDSTRNLLYLGQGGLGLPDEAYYRDDKHRAIRKEYVRRTAELMELAGVSDAATAARTVLNLETRLAAGHWDRVACRDHVKTYNLMTVDSLAALAPDIDWAGWAQGLDAGDALAEVVVQQPSYFIVLSTAVRELPLENWKMWLSWNVVRAAAPYLSGAFADTHFELYGRTLSGVPQQKERWKRAVALVDQVMGEAAGELYVAQHFPPAAKARMVELVANLVRAYRRDIETLEWMGPETRRRALEKLDAFRAKIGYPDRWRDYGGLEVVSGDLLGNVRRASAFELARQLAKIGQPVDRDEWHMSPQTVNAYYGAGMNEIVFPAAILRPPFFDPDAEDAVNYGGIGAVIGHEIGHGFDDQGSRYDGLGNLVDWWSHEDRERFARRAEQLVSQYNAFEPRRLPGHRVNGALTVGENIGDLGGVTVAYQAYVLSLDGSEPPVIDGTTGQQRVFLGWAQCWRYKARDEEALRMLTIDPHAPPEFRVNVVRNLSEFYDAFDVSPGDGLWLEAKERVRIW
jgi:putative endopeptidase